MIIVDIKKSEAGIGPEERIAQLHIINNLSNKKRPVLGNYTVIAKGQGWEKKIEIKNHKRDHGVGPLVRSAIRRAFK